MACWFTAVVLRAGRAAGRTRTARRTLRGDASSVVVVATSERPRSSTSSPGRLGRVVALVVEVGLVHDPRDLPQHRVVELVAAQERLEAAVAAVVGELDAAHVERRRVRRHLVGVVDEDELRLRVDEAPDQPRAGGPVDVAVRGASPTSRPASSTSAASRRPPAARARAPAAGSSRARGSGGARGEAAPASGAAAPAPRRGVAPPRRSSAGTPRRPTSAIRAASSRSWPRPSELADPDRRLAAGLQAPRPRATRAARGCGCRAATRPARQAAAPTPSRLSLRHSAIRGVDGSRGKPVRESNTQESASRLT